MMRCIFIHINKTGGSSIEKALGLPLQHVTAKEVIAAIGQEVWGEIFKFTVVRNPWDKVVSHYHYRVMTNQTGLHSYPIGFNEWVKRTYGEKDPQYYDKPKMFMPQIDWITDFSGQISMDYIARFENLEHDFYTLCGKLGATAVLPHLKSSSRGNYREYYETISVDIVGKWFSQDIERFGYLF